jgi:putative PEP-CTERM system histidine kinase
MTDASNAAILALIAAFIGGAMALGAASQARRSLSHWTFVVGMLLLAGESGFSCLGLFAGQNGNLAGVVHWQIWQDFFTSLLPGVWLFFSLIYARGNSREFLKYWRYTLIAALVLPAGLAVGLREGLLVAVQVKEKLTLGWSNAGMLLHLCVLLSSVLVLMNLERTFRATVGMMRWRIKFMVLGLGALFLARIYTSSQILLFHHLDPSLDGVNAGALLVGCFLILRSLMRSGHFDVNVYPSHSVIHNSLILLLGGVYLLVVGLLANIARLFGGNTSVTLSAFVLLVGLVLLTVVLLSDRVRLYSKRFVSRHFQRPMYDYRTVWRRFTECTTSRMDQMELCRATVKLVAEIFQLLSVSIWLVDEKKTDLIFAASTSLSDSHGAELTPPSIAALEILTALRDHPEPIDINASKEIWAATLRNCHPDEFHKGGGRICVPMIVGGDVLGFMTLGDRIGGLPFIHQDLDLLKCVGDQVAASLRNLQLSGKLLQVKELEAFQTMSAFFVHDLKNTASTLGLMLKNLPIHFNDPAFREDALRGVAKTVTHINNLISRLSLLRHGLEIRRAEADLNDVVNKALAAHKGALEVEVLKDFQPLPKISIDPEQVNKVITNLVLNATEAVSKQGQVRIQTSRVNGWAVLAVADNGCGMSPEFLNRSLFRPFQTTKKAGLGIGMFQSKMIIEAHGGRIEVESQPGKGTTFRVLLPINLK